MSTIPNPFIVNDDVFHFAPGTATTILMNVGSAVNKTNFPHSVSPLPMAIVDNTIVVSVVVLNLIDEVDRVFTEVVPSHVVNETLQANGLSEVDYLGATIYHLACVRATNYMMDLIYAQAADAGLNADEYVGVDRKYAEVADGLSALRQAVLGVKLAVEVERLFG